MNTAACGDGAAAGVVEPPPPHAASEAAASAATAIRADARDAVLPADARMPQSLRAAGEGVAAPRPMPALT
jgi:hypothetical protein